jgi:hypothetical protein
VPLQLSQHSLTDFVECPRRYYLKHVARQQWPLVETGPGGMPAQDYRGYLQRGVVLHRAIERHLLGIAEGPALTDAHPDLQVWWARFAATDLGALPRQRETEHALIAPLGAANLYVRYDLLAWDDEHAVIVDWKTIRGERAPSYAWFRDRLQTRAYLFALCGRVQRCAGACRSCQSVCTCAIGWPIFRNGRGSTSRIPRPSLRPTARVFLRWPRMSRTGPVKPTFRSLKITAIAPIAHFARCARGRAPQLTPWLTTRLRWPAKRPSLSIDALMLKCVDAHDSGSAR